MAGSPRFPEPFDVELETFLVGPDESELDIDDIFAKSVDQILEDHAVNPADLSPEGEIADFRSLLRSDLQFQSVPAGLILRLADRIVGGYLGCDLSLRPDLQGAGLGAELIIERCLKDGMSPVWHLDTAAYSRAGYAAHAAAWRQARYDREQTWRRHQRWST